MSGKAPFSISFSLFAAMLQVGCVTSQSDETCRVDGAQFLSTSVTEAEICDLFQDRFFGVLGDKSEEGQMSFAINIAKSGTIDAAVTIVNDRGQTAYPTVSVDVMDRELNLSDVERLAQAAGRMMANELAGPAASGS